MEALSLKHTNLPDLNNVKADNTDGEILPSDGRMP